MKARKLLTPIILTRNEELNIERTLAALSWASKVIVLDSYSTDRTLEIARGFGNVAVRQRAFDRHGAQWAHAIAKCGIVTDYALALDADMIVTPEFLAEFDRHFDPDRFDGAMVPFRYAIDGRALHGSLYPDQLRVFRASRVDVAQEGHTQVFRIPGEIYHARAPLLHDDRKPLEDWFASQVRYSALEERAVSGGMATKSWLRRLGLMPVVAGLVAYVRAGGPFGGRLSLQYSYQRVVFESLLAMRILAAKDKS